jgi:hypothetical protein
MPIVETVYHRTTRLDWTQVVTCPHCQARWKGAVVARGYGRGRTTYGFGEESAQANAGTDAFASAVDSAKAMLERARCPRCGKRGGAIVSLVIKMALFYALLAALFIWVGGSLARSGAWEGGASPRVVPIAIVLALVLVPLTVVRELRSVDARVRFEPVAELLSQPPPPEAPVAPPRPAPAATRKSAPAARSAPDSDSLELDLDRSWNKKG